jgi:hypothetical protein
MYNTRYTILFLLFFTPWLYTQGTKKAAKQITTNTKNTEKNTLYSIAPLVAKLKNQTPSLEKPIDGGYVSIGLLRNNSATISKENIRNILARYKGKEKKYDAHKSYLSKKSPILIILAQFTTVLDTTKNPTQEPFACMLFNEKDSELIAALSQLDKDCTVPVSIVYQFIGPEESFWKSMADQNYIYQDKDTIIPLPRTFKVARKMSASHLQEDSLLAFVASCMRTVFVSKDKKESTSQGSEYPVFLSIVREGQQEIPFIMHIIASILKENNMVYVEKNAKKYNDLVEKARLTLKKKIGDLSSDPLTSGNSICAIRLIPEKKRYDQIMPKGEDLATYTYSASENKPSDQGNTNAIKNAIFQ